MIMNEDRVDDEYLAFLKVAYRHAAYLGHYDQAVKLKQVYEYFSRIWSQDLLDDILAEANGDNGSEGE